MRILLLLSLILQIGYSQTESRKVLFLGNSYTAFNNLPQIVSDMADSTGDVYLNDKNTPGGYMLQGHAQNTSSLDKIRVGGWDFVVLQEQSQLPSQPEPIMLQYEVFESAQKLNDTILKYNPCAKTTFYMTWGRENGDNAYCPTVPEVCTYEGMDDQLRTRYTQMANDNEAIISPVGPLWRYIRVNYPTISLYASDGSHPSYAGSYAAACAFYSVHFRKNPELITFDGNLDTATANTIKNAAKTVIYNDLLTWKVGEFDPTPNFSMNILDGHVTFTNTSLNAETYVWDFDSLGSSTDENPIFDFISDGIYDVTLTITNCGESISITKQVEIEIEEVFSEVFEIFPNPVINNLTITSSRFVDESFSFFIHNELGQLILEQKSTISPNQKIALTSFASGIYFCSIKQGDKVVEKIKLIKN